MALNKEQLQAVKEVNHNLIINAGPGTGKTHLLVEKIVYLVNNQNLSCDNILAITFTRKARDEIQKRISKKINTNFNTIFTFHSFAFWILKECNVQITRFITDDVRNKILKEIKEKLPLSNKYKHVEVEETSLKISMFKNNKHTQLIENKDFLYVFNKYKQEMQSLNLIDYDDLIINAMNCIAHNPNINKKLKEKFKYIIIDEFQDTTMLQLQLLLSFFDVNNAKIMAIGDKNQSIYSFRGSNVEIFNLLKNKLNFVKEINLKINYRSTQRILDVANKLVDIKLVAYGNSNSHNDSICQIVKTLDEYSEADFVLRRINDLIGGLDLNQASGIINNQLKNSLEERHFQFKDFAILYRTHYIAKIIEDKLFKASIPYMILGDDSIYKKEYIKFIINFLKFLDSYSLDYFCNILASRYINWGKRNIEKLVKLSPQKIEGNINKLKSIVLQNFEGNSLEKLVVAQNNYKMNFFELLNFLKNLKHPKIIVDTIINYYNLDKLSSRKYADILSFIYKLQDFKHIKEFIEYLENIKEVNYFDKYDNKIVLSSIHSVKGLEFENVFLIGLEEGILPKNLKNLDEEKRLLYVAITRARKNFFAIYTQNRFRKKAMISPFNKFLKDSSCEFIKDENFEKYKKRMLKNKAKQAQLKLFSG